MYANQFRPDICCTSRMMIVENVWALEALLLLYLLFHCPILFSINSPKNSFKCIQFIEMIRDSKQDQIDLFLKVTLRVKKKKPSSLHVNVGKVLTYLQCTEGGMQTNV